MRDDDQNTEPPGDGNELSGAPAEPSPGKPTASRSKRAVTAAAVLTFTGAVIGFSVDNVRSIGDPGYGMVQDDGGLVSVHARSTAS